MTLKYNKNDRILYEKGHCKFGESCNFKHSEREKETKKPSYFGVISWNDNFDKKQKHFFNFECDLQQTNGDKWIDPIDILLDLQNFTNLT